MGSEIIVLSRDEQLQVRIDRRVARTLHGGEFFGSEPWKVVPSALEPRVLGNGHGSVSAQIDYDEAVTGIENEELFELHTLWKSQLLHWENAMLNGLFTCGRSNDFANGMFLVGSAHAPSILRLLSEQSHPDQAVVDLRCWSGTNA